MLLYHVALASFHRCAVAAPALRDPCGRGATLLPVECSSAAENRSGSLSSVRPRSLARRLLLLALPLWVVSVPRFAQATWSIVAVDPSTQEVGAAGATCTVGVEVIFGAVPGKGVILAQAATNLSARDRGVEMIASGASPSEVLALIASKEFNPGQIWKASWRKQQYGVAVLGANPATAHFTGAETVPWSGALAEGTVSVQGNMLYSAEVVEAAFQAFLASGASQGRPRSLAERLLLALEAGTEHGGDKRCSRERAALTAFLAVSRPDDPLQAPSLYLVAPKAFGILGSIRHIFFPYTPSGDTPPAVKQLRNMYERWLESHPPQTSSVEERPSP